MMLMMKEGVSQGYGCDKLYFLLLFDGYLGWVVRRKRTQTLSRLDAMQIRSWEKWIKFRGDTSTDTENNECGNGIVTFVKRTGP